MACYCCISQAHAYNITNSEFIFTLLSLLPSFFYSFFFFFFFTFSSLDFAYSISQLFYSTDSFIAHPVDFVCFFAFAPLYFSGISKLVSSSQFIPLLTYTYVYILHSHFVFSHSFSRCARLSQSLDIPVLCYSAVCSLSVSLSLFVTLTHIKTYALIHVHVQHIIEYTIHSLHSYNPTGSLKL